MKAIIFILAITSIFCEETPSSAELVNLITNSWKSTATALSTTKSKILEEIGQKELSVLTLPTYSIMVNSNRISSIMKNFLKKLTPPDDHKELILSKLEEIKLTKKNGLDEFNIIFSKDNGETSYARIIIEYFEEKDYYNLLFSIAREGFNFDKGMIIFTKGNILPGGTYQRQEDFIKVVSKNNKIEDIETISNAYFLIGAKKVAKVLEIDDLKYPSGIFSN